MSRSLVIGYGNVDRADDGVAFAVVNALRRRQGRPPLGEVETGLEALGAEVDTVFLSQLTPELMEMLCDYERIAFVDAHVLPDVEGLHCQAVTPESAPSLLIHHVTPGMLLALVKALYGREPMGCLVSVRGYDFDFHRGFSPRTGALVEAAADRIERWLAESPTSAGTGSPAS